MPVDGRGLVDADIRRALRPNTKLITVMMANDDQPVENWRGRSLKAVKTLS